VIEGDSKWGILSSTLNLDVSDDDDSIDFLGLGFVAEEGPPAVLDEVMAIMDDPKNDELNAAAELLPMVPGAEADEDDDGEVVADFGEQDIDAEGDIDLSDVSLPPNTAEEKAMLDDLGLILIVKGGGSVWNTYARITGSNIDELGHVETLVSGNGISLKGVCHKHPNCSLLLKATSKYFVKYRAVLEFLSKGCEMSAEQHILLRDELRRAVY